MHDQLRAFSLALLALATSGCVHVAPPKRGASLVERTQAYEQLRPRSFQVWKETRAGVVENKWLGKMLLTNGAQINDPTDLLPVVHPESKTAQIAREYERRTAPWKVLGWLSAGVGTVGVGLLNHYFISGSGLVPFHPVEIYVSMASLGVSLVTFIVGRLVIGDVEPLRLEGFDTYEADLRAFILPDATAPPAAAP